MPWVNKKMKITFYNLIMVHFLVNFFRTGFNFNFNQNTRDSSYILKVHQQQDFNNSCCL